MILFFCIFFFPCIKSSVEYDLTTRNQGLNFGCIIYRFLSKQIVGKLDAQHTDVQHVSSNPIGFFATMLVLFCVKNILAHHMFNCNVAWFVLGIISWVDSCCKTLFIHILEFAHHMFDKMSHSLFYLFKSI